MMFTIDSIGVNDCFGSRREDYIGKQVIPVIDEASYFDDEWYHGWVRFEERKLYFHQIKFVENTDPLKVLIKML